MLFVRGFFLETTPPGLRGAEKNLPPTPDCAFFGRSNELLDGLVTFA